MFAKLLASPYLIYIKLALIAALLAVVFYAAWSIKGAFAEKEKEAAVAEAVKDMKAEIDKERALRAQYQTLADTQYATMLKSISRLQGEFKGISGTLMKERQSNPQFYGQPLPEGGAEQWKKARELVKASNGLPSPP